MVFMFLKKPGKYPRKVSVLSLALISLKRRPIEDHIIKKIKEGSKKTMAIAAVILLGTCDLVDMILVFWFS